MPIVEHMRVETAPRLVAGQAERPSAGRAASSLATRLADSVQDVLLSLDGAGVVKVITPPARLVGLG